MMRIINRTAIPQTINGITVGPGNSYSSDPLDHDGDGKKGGSLPSGEPDAEIERLRSEYTDLTGKKPHHLWKAPRLQTEIDKALEA